MVCITNVLMNVFQQAGHVGEFECMIDPDSSFDPKLNVSLCVRFRTSSVWDMKCVCVCVFACLKSSWP